MLKRRRAARTKRHRTHLQILCMIARSPENKKFPGWNHHSSSSSMMAERASLSLTVGLGGVSVMVPGV